MSENYHYVQLTVESGELHRAFVCTAPADANCRRRPANWEDMESWSPSESDESGFPCWAVEFVNEAGIEDAVYAHPDGVLASVPVSIRYADGVEVTPVLADQGKPSPPNPLPESGGQRPQRLNAKLRASLIDFAKDRIQAAWGDVGETDAEMLAENVVSAQEWAWLSAQVPIVTDEMVEAGARAIFDVRDATDVGEWDDLYRDEQERYICDARAVLEAALRGEA